MKLHPLSLLALLALAPSALAFDYDEVTDGDMSDDHLVPTVVSMSAGSNVISASQQGNMFTRDVDYFTFNIPAGQRLDAMFVVDYVGQPMDLAFMGIQSGTFFTTPFSGTMASDLLGGMVYGVGDIGLDRLPKLGSLGGSTGFVPPLPAGDYTIWLNQTGAPSTVTLDFVIGLDTLGTSYCLPANPNSTGQSATLEASGSSSAAANNVTLIAADLPNNQFGYFLNATAAGFIPLVGGSQGNLCLAGGAGRYNRPGEVMSSGATGGFSLALDLTDTPTPSGSTSVMAGQTWFFQAWYRDANPSSTSNFTSGVSIEFN